MVDQIRFFAGCTCAGGESEYMRGFTSSIRRARGPVGQVAPWNYPMMMAVWKFAQQWPQATPSY
jgi:betaine-aldehyde dehydrogenase